LLTAQTADLLPLSFGRFISSFHCQTFLIGIFFFPTTHLRKLQAKEMLRTKLVDLVDPFYEQMSEDVGVVFFRIIT
jgi:hypothetical protein